MRIVLDANIFISAFLWGGNPGAVVLRIIEKKDTLYITREILDEIENVLERPKFHVDNDKKNSFMGFIRRLGNVIAPCRQIINGSRDESDNKYIECGLAAHADYIVSGDIHLLELKEYDSIKIVTAKKYLETVK